MSDLLARSTGLALLIRVIRTSAVLARVLRCTSITWLAAYREFMYVDTVAHSALERLRSLLCKLQSRCQLHCSFERQVLLGHKSFLYHGVIVPHNKTISQAGFFGISFVVAEVAAFCNRLKCNTEFDGCLTRLPPQAMKSDSLS